MTDSQTNRVIYVSQVSMFSDSDFESVRTHSMRGAIVLSARWKTEPRERWAQLLRGNVGAGSSLLAVLFDGQLVSAPAILVNPSANVTASVDIGVPANDDRAKAIAAAVLARWPRG
jgi:hypothetical protein